MHTESKSTKAPHRITRQPQLRLLVLTNMYASKKDPQGGHFLQRNYKLLLREHGMQSTVVSPGTSQRGGSRLFLLCKYAWLTIKSLAVGLITPADIVIAHHIVPPGIIGVLLSRLKRIPFVVVSHGDDVWLSQRSVFWRKWLGGVARKADAIICVSDDLAANIKRFSGAPNERFFVIPSGVETDLFFPRNKKQARKQLNLSLSKRFILYAGQFIPRKDVSTLLRAMPFIPDAHLLLLGKGELKDALVAETQRLGIASRVSFYPKQSREMMARWMSAATVLVLPTLADARPKIISEAMAAKTPVVATAIPGIQDEVIKHNTSGLLFQPGDARALANSVKKIFSRPAFASRMVQNAYRAAQPSNIFRTTAQRARVYRRLVKKQ